MLPHLALCRAGESKHGLSYTQVNYTAMHSNRRSDELVHAGWQTNWHTATRQTTSWVGCHVDVTRWARLSRGVLKQRKVTVPSQCSGMIPSALDKDDTYSVLIPLKQKPLIHPASDLSSPTIIHLASQTPPFNTSQAGCSARAAALGMNKQNKTQAEF